MKMRKTDIVLVQIPPWSIESPPMGLAYLNTFLENHKIKTSILDLNIKLYNFSEETKKYWDIVDFSFSGFDKNLNYFIEGLNFYLNKLLESDVELVAIGVNKHGIGIANYVCKYIKSKSNKKIILGGYITSLKEEVNRLNLNYVDFIVYSQADSSLAKFIEYYYEKKKLNLFKIIKYIYYYFMKKEQHFSNIGIVKNGKIINNELNESSHSVLNIEYPRYDGFNLNEYTTRRFSIVLSTGCISKCAFCSDGNLWKSYIFRDPKKIYEEIEYLKKKGADFIFFDDLAINGNPTKLSQLCDLLIEGKNKIEWGGNAIPYKGLSSELILKMKKAGCTFLRIGVETGSDELLKRVNKISTIDDCERLLKLCTKYSIRTHINLIVGLPGETDEDFEKTLGFLRKNKKYITNVDNIHIAYITPKSEFETNYKKYGITLPGKDYFFYWYDNKGNNPNLRKKRLGRLITLCHNQGISMTNISAYMYSCQYKDVKDNFEKYLHTLDN